MPALRFLSFLLLLLATISLVTDATRATSGDGVLWMPLVKHWNDIAPTSLAATRRSVSVAIHPAVWTWAVLPVLSLPAWVSFGLLGLAAGFAGRRRRKVNIFIN